MDQFRKTIEELPLNNHISLENIPELDLYMDQVIQLFEQSFSNSKRNEEEKILTKTMINNYAKGKLFFPIKNKKYTKDHILLIALIYHMKGALSINDIKNSLSTLNEFVTEKEVDLEQFYSTYINLSKNNEESTKDGIQKKMNDIYQQFEKQVDGKSDDENYIKKLLLILDLVNMSNNYRRMAEKLVDQLAEE